jgi:beta-galactosidase
MRPLNDGWRFAKTKPGESEPERFVPVTLPHDWLIGDTGNLYESGTGWYERELDASFLKDGQRLILRFDGVQTESTLYVNGREAGRWKYGYTAFEHDITGFLRMDGPERLLLKVEYVSPCSRWYTGAGMYRDVSLKMKNACRFVSDGIYVTTYYRDGRWEYEVDAEVATDGRPYDLRHTLLGAENGIEPWSPDRPRLYTLRSELVVDGKVEDTEETRFGFRTVEFTPDRGFFLNGRRLRLNGVCLHHDLGALGAAVHRGAIRRQFTLLKTMGVNALRTAHNPPSKIFMELADEMGFLVMSELLDMWKRPKTPYDYARFFDEWVEKDAAAWIRRDRNHPSVILWSVGNEILDTHIDPEDGERTLRRLMALVRKHDPKGHAPVTFCSNYMPWEGTQRCADVIKIVGYNYAEKLYRPHHEEHPDWVIYGGETCSTVQSRGVYHFPLARSILADDDLQCSALGNSSTSWGAKSVEDCIIADRETSFSLGQFVWAGQDYIGEPTPYHTKSSYLGHIDTAGFPKDSYFLFQAAWTDHRTAPMVHLFPYWDFSPGQMIDVRVCSNAPRVELFLNGENLGAAELTGRFVADWRVPYRSGALRAVAYNERGETIAETERRSFGDAERLVLEREVFDGLTFVTITAVDRDANPVENANRRVRVSVRGGELLGLDNGDPTDYDQYITDNRRLFAGKLLAIVKPHGDEPPVVTAGFDERDIPVRKIELAAHGYTFTARIFPPEATYRDLYWRLTDSAGIDSPLGTLTVAEDGKSAVVTPKGDGTLYVRCGVKNGRDHIALFSQLELEISGKGRPFLDPYSFVAGGLYNRSNAELTNGNERGVATLRDGESHVGFADLDFGSYGSDELVLPLFPLSGEPFEFEIWEGMPEEGGERLTTVAWDKGSIWNTYREIVCRLPRRLRGVTTLCFVFRQKVHIKGFRFTKYVKAFRKLRASEADHIYGDSFTITPEAVERIGNNVSIVFEEMKFGQTGTAAVELCWRSDLPKNSIRIAFAGKDDEQQRTVEVERAKSWSSAVFPLGGRITEDRTVSLIFLPGCSLDLAWVRFLERTPA